MGVVDHAISTASAGNSPRFRPGSASGQWRSAAARVSLHPLVWFCSWIPADAAGSYNTGKAIPVRWVKRQGRETPDTASPTPGAPLSLSPGDSHITRSRTGSKRRSVTCEGSVVLINGAITSFNSYAERMHWVQVDKNPHQRRPCIHVNYCSPQQTQPYVDTCERIVHYQKKIPIQLKGSNSNNQG